MLNRILSGQVSRPEVALVGPLVGWVILLAPRGTPAPVVKRVHEGVVQALAERELVERFQVFGYEALTLSPAELARLIESDSRRYGEVIKRLSISLD